MKSMNRARRSVGMALAATILLAAPAGADILIEFDGLVSGPAGSVRTVAEAEVPAELVGDLCRISVLAENQASVHIGNDLIVSTGESQAVFVGIEDEANGGTTETYEVVVGPTIEVQVRFGPDELSSQAFGLGFDCSPNPDLVNQTVTTIPPTTAPPTTAPVTTEPPVATAIQLVSTTTVPTTSTTSAPALDEQTADRDLPPSPVASAIVAAPAYAG